MSLPDTVLQAFMSAPVATKTRMECRMALALKSSAGFATGEPAAPVFPLSASPFAAPGFCALGGFFCGPSIILVTVSTVGTRFLIALERDSTYLWRSAYSLAEMV
jgi:hypothetical protein